MMKTAYLLPMIMMFLLTSTAQAQQSQPDMEQIQQLIHATGLDRQIYQIPRTLKETANSPTNPARAFISPVVQALGQVFDPDEMLDIFSKDLTKRLDVPTLLDAMSWYRSDNGQAMLGIQQHVTDPATLQRMSEVMISQQSNASSERMALLKRMSDATQANEIALDMMVNLQAAFMTGLGSMVAPQQQQDFQQVRQSFIATRSMMQDKISKQLLLQQTVALENVSDGTVEEFIDFANTKSGGKLFDALRASLDYTTQTVAARIPSAMKTDQP